MASPPTKLSEERRTPAPLVTAPFSARSRENVHDIARVDPNAPRTTDARGVNYEDLVRLFDGQPNLTVYEYARLAKVSSARIVGAMRRLAKERTRTENAKKVHGLALGLNARKAK